MPGESATGMTAPRTSSCPSCHEVPSHSYHRAMSDADFQQALRIVDENPGRAAFVGGRDEMLVAEAERALGVEFPPSYRRFLEELGAGSFGGR